MKLSVCVLAALLAVARAAPVPPADWNPMGYDLTPLDNPAALDVVAPADVAQAVEPDASECA